MGHATQTPETVAAARVVILVLAALVEAPITQQVMTVLVAAALAVLGVILQDSTVMVVAVLGYWAKAQVEPEQVTLGAAADRAEITAAVLLAATLAVAVAMAVVGLELTVVLEVAEVLVLAARFASFGPEHTDNSQVRIPATYECAGSYCYCCLG